MSDDEPHKSWFERLSHALLREPQDREQLIELLHDAKDRHLLDSGALSMIEGVLQVSEMKVRDVMVPRAQMIVVESDKTPQEVLSSIIESAHSRFPVIGESRDEIIGILLAKDLLKYCIKQPIENIFIRDIVRPATFVPESKRLDILLNEFRRNRNHMAIVVDEYGGVAGIVTIEDVLEQIVGEIEDETDISQTEPHIQKIAKDQYQVNALTPIEEFNEYFNTNYNLEDFDTIGGLVLQKFSHLPKRGESIRINDFEVIVLQAGMRGVRLLKFIQLPKEVK